MIWVAALCITGSIPAHGAVGDAPFAPVRADSASAPTQTLDVGPTTRLGLERDGYTSAQPPPPPPAPTPEVSAAATADTAAIGWSLPVAGRLSSPFGSRPNAPVAGVNSFHAGTDIAAPCGQPVRAAHSGTVVEAGTQGSYGKWVLVDHGDGVLTGYAHSSRILVTEGDHVSAGTTIARVGSTGASTGCHVHFETRVDGESVNPVAFMDARGITLGR